MRLALILASLISGFLTITLVFFRATRKTYPGFGQWTAGVGFLTLGYLVFSLRGLIPEPISILVGNVAFPLGMVLHLDGIRRFLGLSAVSRLWYALPGLDLAAIAVLYYLHDSPSWRHMVNSVAISAPHWAMAALIFRYPVKHKSMFYPVIGLTIALAGLVVLARPIASFFLPQWHLLMDSPFQIGTLAVLIVFQLGENLSLIMLNSERLESELVEAETELRLTVNRLQQALGEQKRSEESLREREEQYRTFFDTSRDCVFMTTLDGRFIDFNEVALEMLGYSVSDRAEVLGKNVASFYANPVEREAHSKRVAAVGFSKDYPVDFRKRDGTIIHALVTTVARKDPQGNVIGFQGTVRDITERKRAEENLRDSEAHLLDLYDNAPNAYFSVGADGFIRRCNKGAEELLGYPREMLEGKRLLDLYMDGSEGKEKAEKIFQKFISGEPVTSEELQMKKADGSPTWISLSVNALRDPDGKVVESRSAVVDITKRKRAEEALRESEEKYRAVFDNASTGIDLLDRDGRILQVNQSLLNMLGYSEEELRQLSFLDITHPEEREISKGKLVALMAGEIESYRLEKRYLRKDGSILWGDLSTSAIRGANGEHSGTIGVISDITDRKQTEEALLEREEKYRNLFNNAEVGMFRTRLDGSEILDMNERFLKIFGWTREEMRGKPSVIHWADPREREKLVSRLNTDGQVTDFECKMLNKQGEVRICMTSLRLYQEQGILEGSIIDITERKRTEELALQSARLRAIADLSSGVAHHFNNLLQIVMASASLSVADLESGDLTEIKTTLEKMLEAATHGSETVKRLQTFANIRADITEEDRAVFDIAATARNAAEISEPLWKAESKKRGATVNLQLDLEEGCFVQGKENEIFEVLVNLIRNASEAIEEGGDVEIKMCKEADEVVIKVRDTGIGIAEDDLTRIFEPFWSTRGVGIGKGMGLAVAHGLVRRHGGTISAQSKVGEGTAFIIRLPLAQEPVTKVKQPSLRAAGNSLTILVIEDEEHIATLLERILTKAGHRAFKSLSGEEGLAIFNAEPVDLVLCDLGMPRMSGWEVGSAIRSACQERGIAKTPFILLTGWGGQELEKEKIAESGIDAVVAKPINSAALLANVQEIARQFNIQPWDT